MANVCKTCVSTLSLRSRPAIVRCRFLAPPCSVFFLLHKNPTKKDRPSSRRLRVPDPGHLHGSLGRERVRHLRLCHGPRPSHGEFRRNAKTARGFRRGRDLIAGVVQVAVVVSEGACFPLCRDRLFVQPLIPPFVERRTALGRGCGVFVTMGLLDWYDLVDMMYGGCCTYCLPLCFGRPRLSVGYHQACLWDTDLSSLASTRLESLQIRLRVWAKPSLSTSMLTLCGGRSLHFKMAL